MAMTAPPEYFGGVYEASTLVARLSYTGKASDRAERCVFDPNTAP